MANNSDDADTREKLKDDIARLELVDICVEKPQLPSVKLDEISYAAPSDDYLKSVAEAELKGYKASGVEAINSDAAAKNKQLTANREDARAALDSDIASLGAERAAADKRIDSDVIKRGLARSSVAVGEKGALEREYLGKVADVRSKYSKKIADIDAEMNAVTAKLTSALNDFNISYAAKLTARLNELKSERDDRVNEVTKFNNDVRAKQAALDESRLKTESSLYSQAIDQKKAVTSLDNLTVDQRDQIYQAVYNRMAEYLSTLPKDKAKAEIRNVPLYREHLSDIYYYKLYDKYGR